MHKTTCVVLEHTRPGKEASPEARQAFEKLLKKQKVRSHPENTCALALQSWLSEEALLLLLLAHCRDYAAWCNRVRLYCIMVYISASVQMYAAHSIGGTEKRMISCH
jgi:hypothetical protein